MNDYTDVAFEVDDGLRRPEKLNAMKDSTQSLLDRFNPPWGPFDYLSLGGRERIHTESLRWLFLKESPLSTHRPELLTVLLDSTFEERVLRPSLI